jgi:hypothetical protein
MKVWHIREALAFAGVKLTELRNSFPSSLKTSHRALLKGTIQILTISLAQWLSSLRYETVPSLAKRRQLNLIRLLFGHFGENLPITLLISVSKSHLGPMC